ncbi:bifunctional 5,10-methylene-tetrahydrofolate dehydrogenase/5,10-methylene-tetrahydrofolate cyclohydrolase [Brumimicrobium glaciale]|uniref:Bifunctional protein FolD n=1 Tax=Brumimicrobium glaciale TaxID=200475 RepID=A0A4V1WFN2_9FLAO|nr:tetrahydrofolate dehydrogenase/cyclohydrolase catalytic domain-containing protein [Brumimicrobium glaciale]RYM33786.1 bifunctional 5,10-methylene-tetrahydrofolate dehydrogenase/5,10-methylene-tetrahydrofolate cyclohydrolase [Brumimicrobium glaciale]
MQILDGKETSKAIRQELAEAVEARKAKGQKTPHLAAVLVGNDGGSLTYVGAKVRACKEIGFESSLFHLEDTITEEALLAKVYELNNNDEIDGFIVQLPLPKHIDEKKITLAIDPKKDVDGFHPTNLGNMVLNLPGFLPATPAGMLELFKRYEIETSGKHCVVIGRSHIVGSPMSILMGRSAYPGNSTVTLTHSRTTNLKELTLQADIIITAIGKPNFLTADMVKEGVVVMDVGITRLEDASRKNGYRIVGDVDFESVSEKASYITPVPGGVGPMTIVSLMMNTLKAIEIKQK